MLVESRFRRAVRCILILPLLLQVPHLAVDCCSVSNVSERADRHNRLQLSSDWEVFNDTLLGGFPDCIPRPIIGCPQPSALPRPYGGVMVRTECTWCPQRTRHSPSQVRVACVGDSLTSGLEASSQEHTYPAQLQAMLGDSFVVTNLGSSAATMQNTSRRNVRAYQRTAMYRSLLANKWDIIVIFLGLNDARQPIACDPHLFLAQECTTMAHAWVNGESEREYVRDMTALTRVALSLGEGRAPRLIFVTPPPPPAEGIGGLNRSVLRDIMPHLLNGIAAQVENSTFVDLRVPFGGPQVRCPGPSPSCALWDNCHSRFVPLVAEPGVVCDFVHASDQGYRTIASAVHKAILHFDTEYAAS